MSVIEDLISERSRIRSWSDEVEGVEYRYLERSFTIKYTYCLSQYEMVSIADHELSEMAKDETKQNLIEHLRSIAYQEFAGDVIEELKKIQDVHSTSFQRNEEVRMMTESLINRLEGKKDE